MSVKTAENSAHTVETKRCPLSILNKCLLKTDDASGFTFFRMGNGPLLMSNIYLSAALITLAKKEINCNGANIECDKVYGFKPTSLITIIGTVTGLLSAFLLPFIGAIVDCTDHRRKFGALVALTMMTIQATQVGTFQSTWLAMAVLQAFNGFFYQVQLLTAYSYLSEIATSVGSNIMIRYSANFTAVMFGWEVIYTITCLVVALAIGLSNTDNEGRGRLGQIMNCLFSGPCYFAAWYFFSSKPARRQLEEGKSLFTDGFSQVFRTAKGIKKHYSSTLGVFFMAVVFCDAGSNAFALIAVTYLMEVCNVSGMNLGIVFIIILISTIPGSYFGAWVSKKTNPITSLRIQLFSMICFNFVAFLTMTSPEQKLLPYIFGAGWGALLGWYYPTNMAILSMIQPKGQEAELTGIFLYCSQILAWLPPLVFTLMNESGIHLKWGGVSLNVYFATGSLLYFFVAPWDKCLDNGKFLNKMKENTNGEDNDAEKSEPIVDSGRR